MIDKLGIHFAIVLGSLAVAEVAFADGSELRANEYLFRGQRLSTADCSRFTQMQTDGNLVTYEMSSTGPIALWASNDHRTSLARPFFAVMQGDGNFVVYNYDLSGATWATNACCFGERVIQQTDGNFVEYNSLGQAIWATNRIANTFTTGACQYPPSKTQVTYNSNRAGSDYRWFATQYYTVCGDSCAGDSACTAWTHYNGTCWIKNGTPGTSSLSGATSGLIIR